MNGASEKIKKDLAEGLKEVRQRTQFLSVSVSISFQIYKTPRAEIPHAANRQLSRAAP
jgi:hypothetical protein